MATISKNQEKRNKKKEEKEKKLAALKEQKDNKSTTPETKEETADPESGSDETASKSVRAKVPKGTRDTTPEQMTIREKAFSTILGVFRRHGAVGIDTPVFELKETLTNKYGEDSKLIYDLADQGGEILSLRYDLTVPFARYIATYGIKKIKRYHIARVYRRDQPLMGRGRFREFYQCDFDIAGENALMVPDAETLKVLTEILDNLQIGEYLVKISHRKILDAMMTVCGVPTDKIRPISSAIDKLDKEPWDKVREEMLQKGLAAEVADSIRDYVTRPRLPCFERLKELRADPKLSKNALAKEAMDEVELLFTYLETFGVLDKFQFDLSLARGLDYYTGVIYEALLTTTGRVGSIAAGGRYDKLVGMFGNEDIPAVGVSVGIERLLTILEELEKQRSGGKIRRTQTQVLIASVGKDLMKARMDLAAEFWGAGIGAEFLHHDNPKPNKQAQYADEEGIPFIVWLGGNEIKEGVVKLKNLIERSEVVVKRTEITAKLKSLLNVSGGSSSSSPSSSSSSTSSASSSSPSQSDYERRAKEAEKKLQELTARVAKLEASS